MIGTLPALQQAKICVALGDALAALGKVKQSGVVLRKALVVLSLPDPYPDLSSTPPLLSPHYVIFCLVFDF